MIVTVVQVRVVRMSVRQRGVPVPMAVSLTGRVVGSVLVLMMHVVIVQVLMLHRSMRVLVFVPLRQV